MSKILLIDDSIEVHSIVTDILSGDHEVFAVESWPEANNYIFRHEIDLILIDVNMPGVKGDKIAKVLQETTLNKPLRIVLFSALDETVLRKLAFESQVSGYIQKTFDQDLLKYKIEKYLKSSVQFNSRVG